MSKDKAVAHRNLGAQRRDAAVVREALRSSPAALVHRDDRERWDGVVALAGNPNTGKSTVFNALTGLRQHTGNWPGKTVTRAEGRFSHGGKRLKLVDLPGTYSLLSTSVDEEIARDFVLFGRPDVTVVVVDATRLERNLNLVLQILEITERVVVCLNLMDEARRKGIAVDVEKLEEALGVPVVPTAARSGEGLDALRDALAAVMEGRRVCKPYRLQASSVFLRDAVRSLVKKLEETFVGLASARWVALRLLDGDPRLIEAVRAGELGRIQAVDAQRQGVGEALDEERKVGGEGGAEGAAVDLLEEVQRLRWGLTERFHEQLMEHIYAEAAQIADRCVVRSQRGWAWERKVDQVVTSRLWGIPLMCLLFALVFWLTIAGANVPSSWLTWLLIGQVYPWLKGAMTSLGAPWWLVGVCIDGMYLATAWVVSVMLPPMAIFFPLFTLLEDLGYLPRVAFNLDRLFWRVGAHGKQALSMMMGFGCNAAGVIATRVIDSPRERLLAILTNNFALCNGRWPTQILLATVFLGALAPASVAGLIAALSVFCVAFLGVGMTFVASWGLSRTLLKGEVSSFRLELPPYRPPRVWQTLYTSLIDRTIFVLWRAVVFALPAGAVIWLSANIHVGSKSVAAHLSAWMDPFGLWVGLNGVILLAYIIAIPANEIVIPTVLMLTVLLTGSQVAGADAGVLFEPKSQGATLQLLQAGGWTTLTALNVMLFSLLHNPCSTTIYTIYKETRSIRWTLVATILPLLLGFGVTFFVSQIWRLSAG